MGMSSIDASRILKVDVRPDAVTKTIWVKFVDGRYVRNTQMIPTRIILKNSDELTPEEQKILDDSDAAARKVDIGLSVYKYQRLEFDPKPSVAFEGISSLELKFLKNELYNITITYTWDEGPQWESQKEFSDNLSEKLGLAKSGWQPCGMGFSCYRCQEFEIRALMLKRSVTFVILENTAIEDQLSSIALRTYNELENERKQGEEKKKKAFWP